MDRQPLGLEQALAAKKLVFRQSAAEFTISTHCNQQQ